MLKVTLRVKILTATFEGHAVSVHCPDIMKMMAVLYDVRVPAINQHLKRIFAAGEQEESAVVKDYLRSL